MVKDQAEKSFELRNMHKKIIVIGLGAATFDLIKPWAEQGILPGFKRLIAEGCCSSLDIPLPSASSVAWASFLTGKRPGGHGVYGHIQADKQGDFVPVDSTDIGAKTLCQVLTEKVVRSSFLFLPVTYPLAPLYGRLIAGQGVPSGADDFIYPAELKRELLREHRLDDLIEPVPANIFEEEYLARVLRHLDVQIEVSSRIIEDRNDRLFVAAFTQLDRIQQYFWHYLDKGSGQSGRNPILDAYRKVDELILNLLDKFPEDDLIVLSDNGAGPIKRVIYMNNWLKSKGFLRIKPGQKSVPYNKLIYILKLFSRILPAYILSRLRQKLRSKRIFFEIPLLMDIDWERTQAFSICERIYLNNSLSEEKAREVVNKLVCELELMTDPVNGRQLIKDVFRGGELFPGPYAESAPHLDFKLIDDSYQVMPETKGKDQVFGQLYRIPGKLYRSGNHRHEGVFLACGPNIRKRGKIGGVAMVDLLPTLLHLLKIEAPHDLAGRSIEL